VIRIAVPDSAFTAPDIGIRQLARLFTHEGLTGLRPDGRAEPLLAAGWTWTPDNLGLRVQLRENVSLPDGQPVTAAMIVDALKRGLTGPATRAQSWTIDAITDVKAVGSNELLLTLNREVGALPEDLSFPLTFGPTGAGTGSFKESSNTATEIVLARVDHHYRGRPDAERIIIETHPGLRTAWASLLRDEVDVVTSVPADAVAFLGSERVASASFLRAFQYQLVFNSARRPFTAPGVRRALNYAIDRDHLISRVFQGRAVRADGVLWPRHWLLDGQEPRYAFDASLATQLLDAAQLPARQDGATDRSERSSQHTRLTFRCLVPANFRVEERIALELQRQLALVGVGIEFDVQPPQQYDAKLRAGDFDTVLVNMIGGPTFNRPNRFFRSGGPVELNVFGYRNPEVERLFDTLKTSHDEPTLRAVARRLQTAFHDDPPTLALAWEERTRAVSRTVAPAMTLAPGVDPLLTIMHRVGEPQPASGSRR
jgi:ABC-type transport system substrate-binding protein